MQRFASELTYSKSHVANLTVHVSKVCSIWGRKLSYSNKHGANEWLSSFLTGPSSDQESGVMPLSFVL
jgi:hypothetical protein